MGRGIWACQGATTLAENITKIYLCRNALAQRLSAKKNDITLSGRPGAISCQEDKGPLDVRKTRSTFLSFREKETNCHFERVHRASREIC